MLFSKVVWLIKSKASSVKRRGDFRRMASTWIFPVSFPCACFIPVIIDSEHVYMCEIWAVQEVCSSVRPTLENVEWSDSNYIGKVTD